MHQAAATVSNNQVDNAASGSTNILFHKVSTRFAADLSSGNCV